MPSGESYHDLTGLLRGLNLSTVCAEAVCPGVWEFWDQRTATRTALVPRAAEG